MSEKRPTDPPNQAPAEPANEGLPPRPEVTPESGHGSLLDHAREKAYAARRNYGPDVGMPELEAMLSDDTIVRYPTRLRFSTEGIGEGMFACAVPLGERPGDGFVLNVHPHFEDRADALPLLVAYHLVAINYGEIADASVAEVFGSTLLGLDREEYYDRLCALADELG